MRQEDLCEGTTIKFIGKFALDDQKKPTGKFKCPTCGRRMKIVSTRIESGVKYFIPQHNPKGFKKQKKVRK